MLCEINGQRAERGKGIPLITNLGCMTLEWGGFFQKNEKLFIYLNYRCL